MKNNYKDFTIKDLLTAERGLAQDAQACQDSREAAQLFADLIEVRMRLEAHRQAQAWWLDHI